jgi:hypothetical protein
MAISRMQQPRQMYGLGSLVKSVTKGVKSAVKGITGAVKDNPLLAAAAFNFAPMLIPGGASTFIGGSKAMFPGVTSLFAKKAGEKTLGDAAKVFVGGSLLGGLLSQAEEEGDPEGITRDVGALRLKLADAYRNQRTFADEPDEEAAIAKQVDLDTAEYNQDMNRTRYALGSPEQNAMKASGIMGLPMNTNPAGVKELDLRDSGGFIPPVGVKEKADDIPAMLSNNEFVFTADAVRGMGGGDVNRGAQRLYDQMKMLEKGGRV